MRYFDQFIDHKTQTTTKTTGAFNNAFSALETKLGGGTNSLETVKTVEKMFFPTTKTPTDAKQ